MFQRMFRCLSNTFWLKSPVIRNIGLIHNKIPSDDTLDKLCIPRIEYHWPSAISPYVDRIEEETVQWGIEYNLIPNKGYQDRVKRSLYGRLVARCYPQADYLLLRAIADYHVWLFLADDLLADRVETLGQHTIQNLTSTINIVDYNRLGDDEIYGNTALLNVCKRLRLLLSDEHYQRFANGIRFWGCSVALQILNHMQPLTADIIQYITIRYFSGNVNSCIDLADIGNGSMLPAEILYRPEVQQMRRCVNNIVCWTNDLYSFNIESQQPGQQLNMVTIYAAQGHSFQQAVDYTAERIRVEINAFMQISSVIGSNCEKEMTGYITGLQDWMRGHQDWYYETKRYSRTFIKDDSDDRGLLKPVVE